MRNIVYRTIFIIILGIVLLGMAGCDENCCDYTDNSSPSVPSGVYSVTGDKQVTIYWSPIIEDDFDYYVVWRSNIPEGPYLEIGTTEDIMFIDTGLQNGRTYFWAVSSVDYSGNESELSYEFVYDTPRPEGYSVIKDFNTYSEVAGFSFSEESVVEYNDSDCDIYLDYDEDIQTFLVRTGRPYTDIQDFGYTDDLNNVNYAPESGWSELGYVEVIRGHSYVIWTADNHFAAFRVTSLNVNALSVSFDYAYQPDEGNGELKILPDNNIIKIVVR
ncbi:MAG: hypothetical protein GY855_09110 [candidate division Zixibacteria bacterium]|nr:hypothetical protein [candidate division Zixibacteria bacterium]